MTPSTPSPARGGLGPHAAYLCLVAAAGALAVLWALQYAGGLSFAVGPWIGLTAAFLAARILNLRLPQGDEVRITLMVGLVGLALRGSLEVLAAAAAAGLVDVLVRRAQDPRDATVERALDVVRGVAVVALMAPWQVAIHPLADDPGNGNRLLVLALVMGVSYALADVLTLAVQQRISGGAAIIDGVWLLLRPLQPVYMVHVSMAAVVLLVYRSLGLWGFMIALLLTLILQNSFSLYLRIRRAYAQTIGALAHAAELDRPQDAGHSQRVADLSVGVARLLGQPSRELERIGYAALLHDVGRIGYEPCEDRSEHAVRGAEIVSAVPFLEGVAPLIENHRACDDSAPTGAIVVGVCCRFDRLRAVEGARVALDILAREERGARLRAVSALTRLVSRDSGHLEPLESLL